MIKSQLIDARNWATIKDDCVRLIQDAGLIGYDIETQDIDRHEGLNEFMRAANGKKLVFDVNRTVVTGFSFYPNGHDTAYYVNLNHADVENRIPWEEAKVLLEAKKPESNWICHNAPFELTMMKKSLGCHLDNVICTLQMAVSTFNEDQYPWDKMVSCGFGGINSQLFSLGKAFAQFDPRDLTDDQYEVASRVLGKSSVAHIPTTAWSVPSPMDMASRP